MDGKGLRFGPNQQLAMKLFSNHIDALRADKDRSLRINQRITADVINDEEMRASVPDEDVPADEKQFFEMLRGLLALMTMVATLRQCEFYFRRYSYAKFEMSVSDHLRNCCEMYFDRIAQIKDRLKSCLNASKVYNPTFDYNISAIIKAYHRAFEGEIRARNHVHHTGRYDDNRISQISLIELLAIREPDIATTLQVRRLASDLKRDWVKKVRNSASAIDGVVEHVAGLIVASLHAKHAVLCH